MNRSPVTTLTLCLVLLATLLGGWNTAVAQTGETDSEEPEAGQLAEPEAGADNGGDEASGDAEEEAIPDDTRSGSLDDSAGSIESIYGPVGLIFSNQWEYGGDFRVGYVRSETDKRDGTSETQSDAKVRLRFGAHRALRNWLVADFRFVVLCTTDECDPDVSLDPSPSKVETLDPGTVTFDELYLHVFRNQRFDVALGRLQTRFVTRAGVFAKSLDRNNSNAFNINWTDGVHGAYRLPNKSVVHFIAEYNDKDGPSNPRRAPLDFSDSSARQGYFMAWESLERKGFITQRGVDLTYLPSSLPKYADQPGPTDDYIGIVTRVVANRPFGNKGRRWNVSAEIGYAPETPSKAAMNLAGNGDVDGHAWAVTASIMDLWPRHSVGLNYARTEAGWLLSPQYSSNEKLIEARWLWRRTNGSTLEARIRFRKDIDQLIGQSRRLDDFDFFARMTLAF